MNRISKLLTKSSLIMKIRTMNYGTCRTLLFAGLCLSNVCLSAAEDMNPDRTQCSGTVQHCVSSEIQSFGRGKGL